MHRFYENAAPSYIRDLSIQGFWSHSPQIPRDLCIAEQTVLFTVVWKLLPALPVTGTGVDRV
jgi:hypothetical protein